MSDEQTSIDIPQETDMAAGAGFVVPADDTPEPESEAPKTSREMMEAELDKAQAKDDPEAKDEKPAKDAKEAKPEPKEQPKAEKAEGEKSDGVKPNAAAEVKDAKSSEGKVSEPPPRFLPKARENWANVPNAVKAEIARWQADSETEAETYRESKQFREELRDYEDLAKRSGTTIKDALTSYVETEKRLHADPETELPRVLKSVGLDPMRAVMAVLKSAGATPEQFAQHVMQNPDQYKQQAQQQPQRQQQPQADPMARQAMDEVTSLKRQLAEQNMQSSVIAPFAAANPRFDELQEPIAKILNSGMVPESMSVSERLEVAYDMAERLNPAPYREAPQAQDDQPSALVNPAAGKKSIKGAPSGGKAPAMRTPSIRESLAGNWPV